VNNDRITFVSIDGCMSSDLVKSKVIDRVSNILKSRDLYTMENVCISATHTHSGPGGFLQYALYQTTSLGFVRVMNFDTYSLDTRV